MPRIALMDRTIPGRAMGAAFIALMVLGVWLTYAVFNKTFVDSVPITIQASKTGLQLPKNADVKLRGMRVGEVRKATLTKGGPGVTLHVAMFPDQIKNVPADVSALIVPKTLFGQKYVALQAGKHPSSQSLQAGDTITQAKVPTEVAEVLNDIYPLLETVQPKELSYTLTAVATALDGRGNALGDSLVRLEDYIGKVGPLTPQLVDDLNKLGEVSVEYADVMPELGHTLANLVVTGDTVVAKKAQLQAFFDETTQLSNTATSFLDVNGKNLIAVTNESVPTLDLLAKYSPIFPCLTKTIAIQTPRFEELFRNKTLHINLELLPLTHLPTGYQPDETPTAPTKAQAEADPAHLGPSCHSLPNSPYNQKNLAPSPPFEVDQKTGIKTRHNKFRTAANAGDPLVDLVQPSMGGLDGEKKAINTLLGSALDIDAATIPDVASLMIAPVLRGSEVKISEATR